MPSKLRHCLLTTVLAASVLIFGALPVSVAAAASGKFHLEEASIADIQSAILGKQLTTTELVKMYLARVKAYNGTCVQQPQGLLGPVATIANAGQVNALSTLDLRPATRKAMGFDDRNARSVTDAVDSDPKLPDALAAAAALDQQFAKTGKLVGPLHGVVMSIKDQDLIDKSSFFPGGGPGNGEGSGFMDKKKTLATTNKEWSLDIANRLQSRWALQQVALQCIRELNVDALTYPTGNIPAPKLGQPSEPTVNGRASNAWTLLGAHDFSTITVPAGFTAIVYDRVADASSKGGTRLVGPIAAKLPVGIDFLGRPFNEPKLLKIAAAYEAASKHRMVPKGFGPVAGEP